MTGCSDSLSDLKSDDIRIKMDDNTLTIQNNFNHSIYYFAIESGAAAATLWTPLNTEENRMRPNHKKRIPVNDISGYAPGKTILFYFWAKENPGSNEIKFRRVETK